jgi:L-lactate permease
MSKRVLMFGAGLAILVLALVSILFILDVITIQDATSTLGKTLSVIVVSVVALVLMISVVQIGKGEREK